jgi:hypothetical protein
MKNDWLTTEIALLRERYATEPSCAGLMALFPRHTPASVRRTAHLEGLSRPLAGVVKVRPGLDRMLKVLEQGPLTSRQIAERLGIQHRVVDNLKGMYRDSFRIAGWEPPVGPGKWAPKWGLANGMADVQKPFARKGKKVAQKVASPFSIASGQVMPPTGSKGRVYRQSMSIRDDELEAA